MPDRNVSVQRARDWWDEQRIPLWAAAPFGDAGLVARAELMVAHLGAYQLRQIDGARYALTHLGPSALPKLEAGMRRIRPCLMTSATARGSAPLVKGGLLADQARGRGCIPP